MGFLTGKKFLITGLASNRSISWGVAKAMQAQGAELALTYQTEKLQGRVEKLAAECGASVVLPCDVSSDDEINSLFDKLGNTWTELDGVIHAIAFVNRRALTGDYVENTSREDFNTAHEISSYSFTALARAGREMMKGRGSMVTMSYLGAERAMPNYNVMGLAKASLEANVRYMANSLGPDGIRVNAVSAGPIKTLAASGISDFKKMLDEVEKNAPMRRNVTIEDVGNSTAFLCSDLAAGITGEVIYVDSGYHILGMNPL